jgi:hypothetical protein
MAATAAGMKDWKNHQKADAANKEHQPARHAAQPELAAAVPRRAQEHQGFKKATADFK